MMLHDLQGTQSSMLSLSKSFGWADTTEYLDWWSISSHPSLGRNNPI